MLLLSLPLLHPLQIQFFQYSLQLPKSQEAVRIFNRYLDTDRAFVQLIIAATPDTYIEALCDPIFGYANVTTLSLMTHVQTTYGAMTAADREANLVRMSAPSSPPALI
jgi:hypothetical protein